MKRVFVILMGVMFLVFSSSSVTLAARKDKSKQSKTTKSAQEAEAVKKREKIKEAQTKLNNTLWQVRLTQITANKKKELLKDVLRFQENKVSSKKFSAEGFLPTNYTLTLKGENIIVWETMQESAKNGMVFWKGEIEADNMRGVLSWQKNNKVFKEYDFVSTRKEENAIPEDTKPKKEEKKGFLW